MKFIKQNKHQVRYYEVKNGGNNQILAIIDLLFDIHSIILTNPTYEETADDVKRLADGLKRTKQNVILTFQN